jgi:guanylate kinase
MKGSLYLLIGPSGVGKNTLINKVIEEVENIYFLPSFTSRGKRVGESDGNPYYFISRKSFEQKIYQDEFLEYQLVNENYYGTSKRHILDKIKEGKNVITDIEILGAIDAKMFFPNNVCTVFIAAPTSEEQIRRIKERHDETAESLKKRIERSEIEKSISYLFDFLICNDNLERAVSELKSIVKCQQNKIKVYDNAASLFRYRCVSQLLFTINLDGENIDLSPTLFSEFETVSESFKRHLSLIFLAKNMAIPLIGDDFNIIQMGARFKEINYPYKFFVEEKHYKVYLSNRLESVVRSIKI